ncbi:unnamed protein product [Cyclocybe aegerita]|uniref:F-box domain-containing protein n=1 Tax=Cyclocybe aegerita TaxID=1973307 RepID=A0A8S0W0D2_CYCAE|nr:unnamed protein product [Cyclocybe aegerita]
MTVIHSGMRGVLRARLVRNIYSMDFFGDEFTNADCNWLMENARDNDPDGNGQLKAQIISAIDQTDNMVWVIKVLNRGKSYIANNERPSQSEPPFDDKIKPIPNLNPQDKTTEELVGAVETLIRAFGALSAYVNKNAYVMSTEATRPCDSFKTHLSNAGHSLQQFSRENVFSKCCSSQRIAINRARSITLRSDGGATEVVKARPGFLVGPASLLSTTISHILTTFSLEIRVSKPFMNYLPPELWLLIAGYARRKDLMSLARVSSMHLNTSRPMIYRCISLRSSDCAPETEYLLLRSAVAFSTENLELITDSSRTPNVEWPPVDSIKRMVNLRHLALRGDALFPRKSVQDKFLDALKNYCPHLKEIEVNFKFSPEFSPDFDLPGLRKVEWCWSSDVDTPDTPFHYSLFLLQASQTTLTHIWFPGVLDAVEQDYFIPFSTFHFPSLQSLVLGYWYDVDSPEVPAALTRFLIAHPTLTEICLGYCRDDESRIYLDSDVLQEGTTPILPSLRRLHAHPSPIRALAKYAPQSLRSLTTLEVGTGHEAEFEIEDHFKDLLAALQDIGSLPNMKKVGYYTGESAELMMGLFSRCMMHFSSLFPHVEVWVGDLPCELEAPLTADSFAELLSKFTSLREVFVRSPSPYFSVLDGTRVLATRCPHLERLISRNRGSAGVILVRISRDREGHINLAEITEEDTSFDEMSESWHWIRT